MDYFSRNDLTFKLAENKVVLQAGAFGGNNVMTEERAIHFPSTLPASSSRIAHETGVDHF